MTDTAQPPGFERFPMLMAHPAYQPAQSIPIPGTEIYGRNREIVRVDYRGIPERMPPVQVRNEDEEEMYAADGYVPAGKQDPAAWVRAHASAPPEDYKPDQYPVWRTIAGVPTLVQGPEDDPEYDPATAVDDDAGEAESEKAEVVQAPSETENLRAQMDQMQQVMLQAQEQMRAMAAENARLKAEAEAASAPDESAPKAAQTVQQTEPRQKRPYNRKKAA